MVVRGGAPAAVCAARREDASTAVLRGPFAATVRAPSADALAGGWTGACLRAAGAIAGNGRQPFHFMRFGHLRHLARGDEAGPLQRRVHADITHPCKPAGHHHQQAKPQRELAGTQPRDAGCRGALPAALFEAGEDAPAVTARRIEAEQLRVLRVFGIVQAIPLKFDLAANAWLFTGIR
jgi:hypothetical protein